MSLNPEELATHLLAVNIFLNHHATDSSAATAVTRALHLALTRPYDLL